jgi:protoporphyrin/coproporphyrin ferrochelatase
MPDTSSVGVPPTGVPSTGVIVMAYGTPRSRDDLLDYYTHIRRGSPPPDELLAELAGRYDAIGGLSPLAERTEAQRSAIARALDDRASNRFAVALGQRHAAPFIEDGVAELAGLGVTDIVGLVLAPHFARASVGQYHERASAAAGEKALTYHRVDHWHLLPEYVHFLAAAVTGARSELPARHKVLFSAHSLPERALDGDPYPDELRASATAVARELDLGPWADWTLCWQSAGRTGDAWRGPDINDVIRDLAGTGRADGVLVCPQGFAADGLEVLYDIDIQARATAEEVGLAFARTRSLNDDGVVMGALAGLIAAQPLR